MYEKLMLSGSSPKDIYFRVSCSCENPVHDCTLYFSKDANGFVDMNLDLPFYSGTNYDWNIFRKIWWRITTSLRILFVGSMDTNLSFMLTAANIKAFKAAMEISERHFNKVD